MILLFSFSFGVAAADLKGECQQGRSDDGGDVGEVGRKGEDIFGAETEDRDEYGGGEEDAAAASFGGVSVEKGR